MRNPWKALFGQRSAEALSGEPVAESTFGERAAEARRAAALAGAAPPVPGAEPAALARLRERFGASLIETVPFRGEWTAIVRPADIVAICRFLRDEPGIGMTLLVDLCAIHWMDREWEHEVVVLLHSFETGERLRLKCRLAPGEAMPSLTPVYPGADWHEREAWDLVGVRFEGHPDLRRILMPEDYDAHPLRRDFPVKGY